MLREVQLAGPAIALLFWHQRDMWGTHSGDMYSAA